MESQRKFRPDPKRKLMDQVREVLRYHHYAYRTEQTYCQWIRRYIHFTGGQTHPRELSAGNVERFLSGLEVNRHVSASTQRQARNAVVFLYGVPPRNPSKPHPHLDTAPQNPIKQFQKR